MRARSVRTVPLGGWLASLGVRTRAHGTHRDDLAGSCTPPDTGRRSPHVRLTVAVALSMVLAVTACSAAPAPSAGPTRPPLSRELTTQVRQEIEANTRAGYAPGIEVVVDDHGRIITLVAGVARRSPRRRFSSNDRFFIGSITKPMIASLILQLVAAHRLSLDDTLGQLLPGVLDTGDQITVAQLLSHRSGLPDVVNDPGYRYVYRQIPRHGFTTPAQVVAFVKHAHLDFAPGTSAIYSNTGFEVLGMIVEKVTGRPLREVLQARIFQPLHLSSATLGHGSSPGHPLVHGYAEEHAVVRDVTTRLVPAYAAGYVAMDGPDLARFWDGLFSGRILPPSQLKAMRTVHSRGLDLGGVVSDYGYGLARQHLSCGSAFGHSGRLPGYYTEAWTMPQRHRSVVAFANRADLTGQAGPPLESLVDEVLCD